MIQIKRKILGEFELYTEEEARQKGIKYMPWWKAETGDWGVSDDGMVSICLGIYIGRECKSLERKYHKYPWGGSWGVVEKKTGRQRIKAEALKYIEMRSYNRKKARTFGEDVLKSRRMRKIIDLCVIRLMAGEKDMTPIAVKFFPTQLKPLLSLKRVLKQKEVIKYMEQEILKRMAEVGIDKPDNYAIRLLHKAAVMAEDDRNPDALIKVAKELNLLLGAYPKRQLNAFEDVGQINMAVLLEKMEKESRKLEAAEVREADDDNRE